MAAPYDPWGKAKSGADDPASDAFAVTPHDTTHFVQPARGLYIGGAGNAVLVTPDGGAVTFVGLTAGSTLPVRCHRVNATGTTATNIVALV